MPGKLPPKSALAWYSAFIVAIFLMAYMRLLPFELIRLRWFDSAGHFFLYGLWGYFFMTAYPQKIKLKNLKLSKGLIIIVLIAISEESLQSFSANRSFTFSDMGFSLLGILCAAVYLTFTLRINALKNDIAQLSAKNDLDRK